MICYANEGVDAAQYQRLLNEVDNFIGVGPDIAPCGWHPHWKDHCMLSDPVLLGLFTKEQVEYAKIDYGLSIKAFPPVIELDYWPSATRVVQTGYHATAVVSSASCYDYYALKSALFMSRLRYQLYIDHGKLMVADDRFVWMMHDFAISKKQFIQDDEDISRFIVPPSYLHKTIDGYHAFSDADIEEYNLQKRLVELKKLEESAIARLPVTTTAAQALTISRTMATDPLGRLVSGGIADSVYLATAGVSQGSVIDDIGHRITANSNPASLLNQSRVMAIDPGVRSRIDLPAGIENVLNQEQEIQRQVRMASTSISQSPTVYRRTEAQEATQRIEARSYDYWMQNYPKAELRNDDNQNVDPKLLNTVFLLSNCLIYEYAGKAVYGHKQTVGSLAMHGQPCLSPPLVNLRITPRQKPIPKLGFIGSNPWLSKVVGIIPFVGWIASTALSAASSQQQRNFAKSWQIPVDAFSPQYYPKAFWVILPLDKAQTVLKQPWYLPAMHADFDFQIKQQAMSIMGFAQ